jgi:hypothetical protein
MKVTVKQLGENLGVDYMVASNLMKIAIATNQAKEVGSVASPSGKGKPSAVYEVNEVLTFDLSEKSSESFKKSA